MEEKRTLKVSREVLEQHASTLAKLLRQMGIDPEALEAGVTSASRLLKKRGEELQRFGKELTEWVRKAMP